MALNKKYKGNTLPEVLVALVIVSFCATLAVVIYINIQQNTQPFIKMKANELALKYMAESKSKKEYFDGNYKEEEYTLKKTVTRSADYSDCMLIEIAVFNSENKKLIEHHQLIHAD